MWENLGKNVGPTLNFLGQFTLIRLVSYLQVEILRRQDEIVINDDEYSIQSKLVLMSALHRRFVTSLSTHELISTRMHFNLQTDVSYFPFWTSTIFNFDLWWYVKSNRIGFYQTSVLVFDAILPRRWNTMGKITTTALEENVMNVVLLWFLIRVSCIDGVVDVSRFSQYADEVLFKLQLWRRLVKLHEINDTNDVRSETIFL